MRNELDLITHRLIRNGLMMASLLLVAAPAMAETRVGAAGGVSMADMSGVDEGFLSSRGGWGASGVVELDLTQNLALASRPSYAQKGTSGPFLGVPGEVATRMDLDYFEIPLLVKVSAGSKGVRPYLIAGPSLGLRHRAVAYNSEFDVYGLSTGPETREDIEQDIEPIEFSFNAGVGVGLNVGRTYSFLEGIWSWGLTDVTKAAGTRKNTSVQLRVGVTLRLGGH